MLKDVTAYVDYNNGITGELYTPTLTQLEIFMHPRSIPWQFLHGCPSKLINRCLFSLGNKSVNYRDDPVSMTLVRLGCQDHLMQYQYSAHLVPDNYVWPDLPLPVHSGFGEAVKQLSKLPGARIPFALTGRRYVHILDPGLSMYEYQGHYLLGYSGPLGFQSIIAKFQSILPSIDVSNLFKSISFKPVTSKSPGITLLSFSKHR